MMKTLAIGLAALVLAGCAQPKAPGALQVRYTPPPSQTAEAQAKAHETKAQEDQERVDLYVRRAAEIRAREKEKKARMDAYSPVIRRCLRENAISLALASTEAADLITTAALQRCRGQIEHLVEIEGDKTGVFVAAYRDALRPYILEMVISARASSGGLKSNPLPGK